MSKDTAAIRDQLGNDPDTTFFLNADYDESVGIDECTSTLSTNTLGHAWIAGSSSNGLVGTNTATGDGSQQVVGGAGRVETIVRVVNPKNAYKEYFRDTDFKDTSLPNTANWDTTNYRLSMHTLNKHSRAYNTTATFKSIFLNSQTIFKVRITASETRYSPTDLIKYFISADGGSSWGEININIWTALDITGNDLRVKVMFFGQGGSDTYLEDLKIEYST